MNYSDEDIFTLYTKLDIPVAGFFTKDAPENNIILYRKYNKGECDIKTINKFKKYDYFGLRMGTNEGNRIVALDIDMKTKRHNGDVFLKMYEHLLWDDNIPRQKTKSGGYHFLFKLEEDKFQNIQSKSLITLTIKNTIYTVDFKNTGLLFCAPSKHGDGREYKWEILPHENMPYLPDELYKIILTNDKKKTKKFEKITEEQISPSPSFIPQTNPEEILFYRALLECISAKRINSYKSWVSLCFLLQTLKLSVYDFIYLSKKDEEKYNYKHCVKLWNSTEKNNKNWFNKNSLLQWAKQDDEDMYYKVLENYSEILIDDEKYDCELIESRYLEKSMVISEEKNIIIKSPYGSGKSTVMRDIASDFSSVLIITSRVSLAKDFSRVFGFENYLIPQYKFGGKTITQEKYEILTEEEKKYVHFEFNEADRFICQLDSIINISHKSYDLVICDEAESLLQHFAAETMRNKSFAVFSKLKLLLELSKKNYFLDGDVSNRTIEFVKHFGSYKYINNDICFNKKNIILEQDRVNFVNQIVNDLNNGRRIGFASMSLSKMKDILNDILEKTDVSYVDISSETNTDVKNDVYKDVNKYIRDNNIQLFCFSPSITIGVDIIEEFDCVYGLLSSKSCCSRDFLQMLARFRNTPSNNDIICLNTSFYKKEDLIPYTYKDLLNVQNNINLIDRNTRIICETNNIDITVYNTILLHNETERLNNLPGRFISTLRDLCVKKGYKFTDKCEMKINYKNELKTEENEIPYLSNKQLDFLVEREKITRGEQLTPLEKKSISYNIFLKQNFNIEEEQTFYFNNERIDIDVFNKEIEQNKFKTEFNIFDKKYIIEECINIKKLEEDESGKEKILYKTSHYEAKNLANGKILSCANFNQIIPLIIKNNNLPLKHLFRKLFPSNIPFIIETYLDNDFKKIEEGPMKKNYILDKKTEVQLLQTPSFEYLINNKDRVILFKYLFAHEMVINSFIHNPNKVYYNKIKYQLNVIKSILKSLNIDIIKLRNEDEYILTDYKDKLTDKMNELFSGDKDLFSVLNIRYNFDSFNTKITTLCTTTLKQTLGLLNSILKTSLLNIKGGREKRKSDNNDLIISFICPISEIKIEESEYDKKMIAIWDKEQNEDKRRKIERYYSKKEYYHCEED